MNGMGKSQILIVFGEEGLVYRKACFEASFKQTFLPSSLRHQPCSTDKKRKALLLGILVSKLSPCQQSKQIAIHSHHPDQGLHIVARIRVASVLKWIFCKMSQWQNFTGLHRILTKPTSNVELYFIILLNTSS